MRPLLFLTLLLAGCGHQSGSKPTPGPFADIAGTYSATVTAEDTTTGNVYVPLALGTVSTITVTDAGTMWSNSGLSITGAATYQLTRTASGSFVTNSRLLGAALGHSTSETGSLPAALSSLMLNASEYGPTPTGTGITPAGSATYTLVKVSSG